MKQMNKHGVVVIHFVKGAIYVRPSQRNYIGLHKNYANRAERAKKTLHSLHLFYSKCL